MKEQIIIKKVSFCYIVIFFLVFLEAYGQDTKNISQRLTSEEIHKELEIYRNKSGFSLKKAGDKYLTGNNENLKRNYFVTLIQLAQNDEWISERNEAVELICEGLADIESSELSNLIIRQLGKLDYILFSEKAKASLSSILNHKELNKNSIMLIGNANLKSLLPRLKKIVSKIDDNHHVNNFFETNEWASLLVLAKSGDSSVNGQIINYFNEEKNIIKKATIRLKEIAFICQPFAISLLKDCLFNEKKLPKTKKGESPLKVANWAAHYLSTVITDFPVKKNFPGYYTEKDIKICQNWIKAQNKKWDIIDQRL